jgi:hypothetical protein
MPQGTVTSLEIALLMGKPAPRWCVGAGFEKSKWVTADLSQTFMSVKEQRVDGSSVRTFSCPPPPLGQLSGGACAGESIDPDALCASGIPAFGGDL